MLVRIAAPQRGASSEDIGEEEAAVRIQAQFRGRAARKKANLRKVNAGMAAGPEEPAMRHGQIRPPWASPESLTLEAKARDGEVPPALGKRGSFSGGRLSLTTDWTMIRSELEERETTVPKNIQKMRVSAFLLFEEPSSSLAAKILSMLLLLAILVSVVCFMVETMPECRDVPAAVWLVIEVSCTIVFTIEYTTRLLVCGVVGVPMKTFIKDTMNIFDLLAILPFYAQLVLSSLKMAKMLGVLRIVRLVRLFRIFKLGRYSVGLQLMAEALKNSSQALGVLSFFLCIGILLFSSAVFYVERMACPDVDDLKALPHMDYTKGNLTDWDRYVGECRSSHDGFARSVLCCDEHGSPLDFPSIVETFWWCAVTMTTVGFGEVYPRTELGRVVATATMLSGILLIALPVAIIGRKFQEVYEEKEYRDMLEMATTSAQMDNPPKMDRGSSMSSTATQDGSSALSPATPKPELEAAAKVDGPTLGEMSRRMRLMKMPDANMTALALELAEELEEADDMQKEINSMEKEEKERQEELLTHFDTMLKRFQEVVDPERFAKGKTISWSAIGGGGLQRGMTGLVASAVLQSKSKSTLDGEPSSPRSPKSPRWGASALQGGFGLSPMGSPMSSPSKPSSSEAAGSAEAAPRMPGMVESPKAARPQINTHAQ